MPSHAFGGGGIAFSDAARSDYRRPYRQPRAALDIFAPRGNLVATKAAPRSIDPHPQVPAAVTANDLLAVARQAFPTESNFVWCSARRTHPVPTCVEAGDRVRVAGLDSIVTEWTCDERGRRLRAELCAWVPSSLLSERWIVQSFARCPIQPTPEPLKWRS